MIRGDIQEELGYIGVRLADLGKQYVRPSTPLIAKLGDLAQSIFGEAAVKMIQSEGSYAGIYWASSLPDYRLYVQGEDRGRGRLVGRPQGYRKWALSPERIQEESRNILKDVSKLPVVSYLPDAVVLEWGRGWRESRNPVSGFPYALAHQDPITAPNPPRPFAVATQPDVDRVAEGLAKFIEDDIMAFLRSI